MRKLPVRKSELLVVGDLDFTEFFKAAGIKQLLRVNIGAEALNAKDITGIIDKLVTLVKKQNVGFIIIQESLRRFFEDKIPRGLGVPVIYVPDFRSAKTTPVKEYYESLIRRYLGITLELG